MSKMQFVLVIIVLMAAISCTPNYNPKPRAYFRIHLPEKTYSQYTSDCKYGFMVPDYARVERDTDVYSEPCWINIVYYQFDASINISYKPVTGSNLNQLLEDSRTLVYKHTIKADAIGEKLFANPEREAYGVLYEIKGNAASAVQFYITDSTKHFLRGSLYFNCRPNQDSLAPVIAFIKSDIEKIMETIKWN